MPQVLVVVDAADGSAPKPALELLTLARRIGSPSAVVFGPDAERAVETLASHGAEHVYLVKDHRMLDHLVVPKVDALEQITAHITGHITGQLGADLAAVLLTASTEGKEIGARLALRLDAGFISDAVDVNPGARSPGRLAGAGYETNAVRCRAGVGIHRAIFGRNRAVADGTKADSAGNVSWLL